MFRESRLLHFNENPSVRQTPEAGAQMESSAPGRNKEQQTTLRTSGEMVDQILGLNVPGMKELSTMSDEDYAASLKTKNVDDLLPPSEAGQDAERAIDGMVKDFERIMKSMNFDNIQNLNFQQFFSAMGQVIDNNLKPLLAKYKGRESELLQGLYRNDFRKTLKADQVRLANSPDEKVSNPVRGIVSVLDTLMPSSYDRLLQKELKNGKTLTTLRVDYERMKREAEKGGLEERDAESMLKAIDTYTEKGKAMQKKLTSPDVLKAFPKGVTFAIDPKDGEVVMQISNEKMADFVNDSPDAKKLPGGNVRIDVNGKTVEIRYDIAENAYEVVM